MRRLFLKAMAAGAGIILAGSAGVRGAILYQNTGHATGQVLNFPNGQEIGEQIWLGTGTTPMYLTNFSFEYYSPFISYSGPVQADVILYANNGAPTNGYHTPGSPFFVSGFFNLQNPWQVSGTNSATVVFQLGDLLSGNAFNLAPNFILPSNFTFSVTFQGMQGADSVGLPVFNPPQVGANAGDYWYDVSGNWELLTNSIGPIAFGAQFLGTPIPEPSVLCLGALGVAAAGFMARRRQRRG
jgi:hypothetical protein